MGGREGEKEKVASKGEGKEAKEGGRKERRKNNGTETIVKSYS